MWDTHAEVAEAHRVWTGTEIRPETMNRSRLTQELCAPLTPSRTGRRAKGADRDLKGVTAFPRHRSGHLLGLGLKITGDHAASTTPASRAAGLQPADSTRLTLGASASLRASRLP